MSKAELSETYERYALGLARGERLPASQPPGERRAALVDELKRRGIKGWPDRGTFFTRHLPPGCYGCLQGKGSNLCLTTRCTRDCFFCFNPKPRSPGVSVHGLAVSSEAEAAELLAGLGIRSAGLSGGEPLLDPALLLKLVAALRRRLGAEVRLDVYTNGDLLTPGLAHQLRLAGLDGVRLNLAANGYDLRPARVAVEEFGALDVEIPVVPEDAERLRRLVVELDELGASNLILHELFASAQNLDALRARGYTRGGEDDLGRLSWEGVPASDVAALELLLYSLDRAQKLSLYYCSCDTQSWIAERVSQRGQALK